MGRRLLRALVFSPTRRNSTRSLRSSETSTRGTSKPTTPSSTWPSKSHSREMPVRVCHVVTHWSILRRAARALLGRAIPNPEHLLSKECGNAMEGRGEVSVSRGSCLSLFPKPFTFSYNIGIFTPRSCAHSLASSYPAST